MNREIRFKGRSKYNGEWIRGDLQTCYGIDGTERSKATSGNGS